MSKPIERDLYYVFDDQPTTCPECGARTEKGRTYQSGGETVTEETCAEHGTFKFVPDDEDDEEQAG